MHPRQSTSAPSQPTSAPSQPASAPRRRRKNGNWTVESLQEAIAAIDDGVPIRKASRAYGIPASSLRDHLTGRTVGRHRGRPGVLTVAEESLLVAWILKMQDIGHPVTITQ